MTGARTSGGVCGLSLIHISIEISKLFDNFYKGDKSRHKDSTGLGLSIVKEICLILHWEIEARQEDDDVIIQINTNNNSIYLEEKDV